MNYFSVPWFNKNEWFEVYNGIFSSTNRPQKVNALNIMQIWKARNPFLPSGIESTLCLLGVELQEGDEYLIRLAYSTAIMRFINHTLDDKQAKGMSILKAAAEVGIPKWVVNLRHETAHGGSVPSMNTLQNAASVALNWLFNNYWVPQYEMMSTYDTHRITNYTRSKQTITDSKIEALIPFYTTCGAFLYVFKIKTLTSISEQTIKKQLIDDIYSLELTASNDFKVLLRECLVKIITIFKTQELNKAYPVETLLFHDNALMLSVDAFSAEYDPRFLQRLPWQFVCLWEPLLSLFYSYNFIRLFLERLLLIVQDENASETHRLTAGLWLKECFNALFKCKCFEHIKERFKRNPAVDLHKLKSKELKSLLVRQYPHFRNDGLTLTLNKSVPESMTDIHYLSKYFEKCNTYTKTYLDSVLALTKPPLPNDCKKKLRHLADIAGSLKPRNDAAVPEKIYTVDDISDSMDLQDDSCMILDSTVEYNHTSVAISDESDDEDSDLGIWRLAHNDVEWSKCPIGILPWQTDLPRNPLLPSFEDL